MLEVDVGLGEFNHAVVFCGMETPIDVPSKSVSIDTGDREASRAQGGASR